LEEKKKKKKKRGERRKGGKNGPTNFHIQEKSCPTAGFAQFFFLEQGGGGKKRGGERKIQIRVFGDFAIFVIPKKKRTGRGGGREDEKMTSTPKSLPEKTAVPS